MKTLEGKCSLHLWRSGIITVPMSGRRGGPKGVVAPYNKGESGEKRLLLLRSGNWREREQGHPNVG